MTRRKRSSRFGRGLLLYVLIFLLLAAAALGVLYLYLSAYEASRSTTGVKQYLNECADERLSDAWETELARLDQRVQSAEKARTWFREKLKNASFRELRNENETEKRYGIFDENGVCFETLKLRSSGEGSWGFTGWTVAEEACSIDAFTEMTDVTVPAEYTVEFGGMPLDAAFIVQTDIPYEILEPCREYTDSLPTMVRYEVGPFLAGPELRVMDKAGNPVMPEEQTELRFLDNCSPADRERVHEFALRFLNALLPYAGDLNHSAGYYWYDLYPLIVHEGVLEERLLDYMRAGFGYNNTYSIDIIANSVVFCSDLGGGKYLIDLTYRTETVGLEGPVQEDNRTRLLIVESEDGLLTEAMFNY